MNIATLRISAAQCRAARASLNLSRREVCAECGLGTGTLFSIENDVFSTTPPVAALIRRYFEDRGVRFTFDAAGHGLGVEFRPVTQGKS